MTKRDAMSILELPAELGLAGIKTAYRRAVKKYHPDRNPGVDPEYIKKVNAAYTYLCNLNEGINMGRKKKPSGYEDAMRRKYKRQEEEYNNTDWASIYFQFKPCKSHTDVLHLKAWLIRSGRAESSHDMWVTMDMRVYAIKDLKNQHLVNVKGFIEKNGVENFSSATYMRICWEIQKRGINDKLEAEVVSKTKIKLQF